MLNLKDVCAKVTKAYRAILVCQEFGAQMAYQVIWAQRDLSDPKVKKENLREENDVKSEDQKEIKKETKVKKELKRKEIQKNKNMKKMEVEVRL